MTVQEELEKEVHKLGYSSADEAIRSRWNDVPDYLKEELVKLGFNPEKQ